MRADAPTLETVGGRTPLMPWIDDAGDPSPRIAAEPASEVGIFLPGPRCACIFGQGAAGPLSALRRRTIEVPLADPEELHGTGLYDEVELFAGVAGAAWRLRYVAVDRQTTIFAVDGGPALRGLGRSAGAWGLADGVVALLETEGRPALALVSPEGQVVRAPVVDWLAGEEALVGIRGGWLFSAQTVATGRVLYVRRLSAAGLGPRRELGRIECGERHTYGVQIHMRGGTDDGFVALAVAMPGEPVVATAFLRGGRWGPLELHEDAASTLDVAFDPRAGVGRVAWIDRSGARTVVETCGAGVRRERVLDPDERAVTLLGPGALTLTDVEGGLVGEIHRLAGATPLAPSARFVIGLPGAGWSAEVHARGDDALLLLARWGDRRRWAVRAGADGAVAPIDVPDRSA